MQHHTNLYLHKREEQLLLLSCWIVSSFLWLPGTAARQAFLSSSQRAPPTRWTWAWVKSKGCRNCCKLVIATVPCAPLEHLHTHISTRCEEPLWLLLENLVSCAQQAAFLGVCAAFEQHKEWWPQAAGLSLCPSKLLLSWVSAHFP